MNLFTTKTFWTGLAGLAAGLGGYLSGEAGGVEALQIGLTGLVAIFLRHGLVRSGRGE